MKSEKEIKKEEKHTDIQIKINVEDYKQGIKEVKLELNGWITLEDGSVLRLVQPIKFLEE